MFHFSERGDIEVFHPRAPLGHPDTEPLVFAIDEWHQPLYFFPRDCPRIGVWPVETTSEEDKEWFSGQGDQRMLLYIDHSWQARHAAGEVWRYEFGPGQFEDCDDHGCWASRSSERPATVTRLTDLPGRIAEAGCRLIVADLSAIAARFWPDTTLHVSMIRMRNLEGWTGAPGTPVSPSQ